MGQNRDPHSTRQFGVGIFGNSVIRPSNPDNVEELSAAQVRQAYEAALAEDERQKAVTARVANAEAWMSEHPEYIVNGGNNYLMNHQLKSMFGEIEWNLTHYDAAYNALQSSSLLVLDKNVLAAQQKEAARARAASERERNVAPTEKQLWEMPLEDLRRLEGRY